MNFKPTRDWVVFDLPKVEVTNSGIIVPEKAQASIASNIVKVIKAGPKCELVKEGDTVLVHPESGALVIKIEGKEYACVNEFQIVGVIPQP